MVHRISYSMPILSAIFVLMVSSACGGEFTDGETENFSAVTRHIPSNRPILPDPCTTAPADSTLVLAGLTSVSIASPSTAYGSTACGRYIVDVDVIGQEGSIDFQWAVDSEPLVIPNNETNCENLRIYERIYKKGLVGWKLDSSATYAGEWHSATGGDFPFPAECSFAVVSGEPFAVRTSPQYGTVEKYRIAVRVKNIENDSFKRVKVEADFTQIPR